MSGIILAPRAAGVERQPAFAVLPWLLIPYDSLTYLIGADLGATSQTLPLTALLALPYVLALGPALRTCGGSRRVGLWLLAVALVMVFVTVANVIFESAVGTDAVTALRLPTALRQGLSLVLGIASFFMFQDALLRVGLTAGMRWVLIGGLPSLALAAIQLSAGEYRVQGFSSEPSHLADMLVWALLPACGLVSWPRFRRTVAGLLSSLVLLATFSTTGFLKALALLAAYFVARGQAVRALLALPALLGLGYLVLSLWPENYVFLIFSVMSSTFDTTGDLGTASFIDRFFGFAGPIGLLGNPHAWWGFGLGGDSVYFDRLFDPATADAIREVKGDIPSISSLQGKLLMYGGVVGYGLYISAWASAWRTSPAGHAARFMIPALFLGTLFSLGPLFLPYVWLWLAVGATSAADPVDRMTSCARQPIAPRNPG